MPGKAAKTAAKPPAVKKTTTKQAAKPTAGSIEKTIDAEVRRLKDEGFEIRLPLVAIAKSLAKELDRGFTENPASVARELRLTISELAVADDKEMSDELKHVLAGLSTPVRDTTDS